MFGISTFGGVQLVVSGNAIRRVTHWPEKPRSRRMHKKLTKRLGPQFSYEPGAWMMADGRMIVHPKLYDEMNLHMQSDRSAPIQVAP